MRLLVSAQRMFSDGTIDTVSHREQVVDRAEHVGAFLLDYASEHLGLVAVDGTTCDAIDVTITASQ